MVVVNEGKLNKIEKLTNQELEDLNINEGYSYIYSYHSPKIVFAAKKDEKDTFQIIDFATIKTTWIARAVHNLIHETNREEIKIIEAKAPVILNWKMSLEDIFNILTALDRESL